MFKITSNYNPTENDLNAINTLIKKGVLIHQDQEKTYIIQSYSITNYGELLKLDIKTETESKTIQIRSFSPQKVFILYMNDFLTVSKLADHLGITRREANNLITTGKEQNNSAKVFLTK
jgi:biotin operon repressor